MEDELWNKIYRVAKRLGKDRGVVRGAFSDAVIVSVYFWAVVHDRPTQWACHKRNWRGRGFRSRLPSPSTMSRRLRTRSVVELMKQIEQALIDQNHPSICRLIDAKPLPVSGHSSDPDVGYGRAASSMAKGYKFHAIYDGSQGFVRWSIRPMNVKECVVAKELIATLVHEGYLVGDNAFDSNKLYDEAGQRGIQLLAPQRKNAKSVGHRRHSPYRLKAIEMQARPLAQDLLTYRRMIETVFAQFTTLAFGLSPLPNWVRTLRRVENWVRAKLILFNLYRQKQTTCNV